MSGLFLLVAKHNCEMNRFSFVDECELRPNVKRCHITLAVGLGFISLFTQLIFPKTTLCRTLYGNSFNCRQLKTSGFEVRGVPSGIMKCVQPCSTSLSAHYFSFSWYKSASTSHFFSSGTSSALQKYTVV